MSENPAQENTTPEIPLHDRVGDRFVTIFVTVTLLLFFITVGAFIYTLVSLSSLTGENHTLALQAQAATKTANQSNINSCALSNQDRADTITIWEDLLKLPPTASQATRALVDRDLALVRQAYAPRNCAKLYPN